jgi:hypothetical protein
MTTATASRTASHYMIRIFDEPQDTICEDGTELQDMAMACEHLNRDYAAYVIFTDGTSERICA